MGEDARYRHLREGISVVCRAIPGEEAAPEDTWLWGTPRHALLAEAGLAELEG